MDLKHEIIGTSTLYCCDCMELMATLPDQSIDLAIVDVPYGININHNMGRRKDDKPSNYKKAVWDSAPPNKRYFMELFRVSDNQIIWGANHFISLMPYNSPCWLVWDKLFSEDISFASVELAWTSFQCVSKKYQLSSQQNDRIHPTQKPVALYKWLLTRYAKQGDKILDTHFGSASIAVACNELGFNLTASEIDQDYFEAACKRVREANRQQLLNFEG